LVQGIGLNEEPAMSLLSQSCVEAARLLSDSQDAQLALPARVGLRLHLAICRRCQRYKRQLQLMREAFQIYPQHLQAASLPEEFRREVVQKLKDLH
jgi:hypothetical protein